MILSNLYKYRINTPHLQSLIPTFPDWYFKLRKDMRLGFWEFVIANQRWPTVDEYPLPSFQLAVKYGHCYDTAGGKIPDDAQITYIVKSTGKRLASRQSVKYFFNSLQSYTQTYTNT